MLERWRSSSRARSYRDGKAGATLGGRSSAAGRGGEVQIEARPRAMDDARSACINSAAGESPAVWSSNGPPPASPPNRPAQEPTSLVCNEHVPPLPLPGPALARRQASFPSHRSLRPTANVLAGPPPHPPLLALVSSCSCGRESVCRPATLSFPGRCLHRTLPLENRGLHRTIAHPRRG